MSLGRAVVAILRNLFILGLAAAGIGAVIGLIGYMDARSVSFVTLCGAGLAFVASVGYLIVSDLQSKDLQTRAHHRLK